MSKTALYRHFDCDNNLLYVGVSSNLKARTSFHASVSDWFAKVHRIEVDWHETRNAALEAEKIAIQTEMPSENKTFSKKVHTLSEAAKNTRQIIDTLGHDAIAAKLGVALRRVYRARTEPRIAASWYAGLCEMAGQDLPRHLFTFKGIEQ